MENKEQIEKAREDLLIRSEGCAAHIAEDAAEAIRGLLDLQGHTRGIGQALRTGQHAIANEAVEEVHRLLGELEEQLDWLRELEGRLKEHRTSWTKKGVL